MQKHAKAWIWDITAHQWQKQKHDTLHDLLRCPLIPVFWVGLCVPWQRSWLSHVAAAAQPTRLNSQSLVPLHALLLNMRANKAQRISWPYKQKRYATPEALVPGGYKPPNTNLQLISAIRIGRRGHDLLRNSANFRSRSDALQMTSSHNELRGKQLGTSSTFWMGAPRSNQSQALQICWNWPLRRFQCQRNKRITCDLKFLLVVFPSAQNTTTPYTIVTLKSAETVKDYRRSYVKTLKL